MSKLSSKLIGIFILMLGPLAALAQQTDIKKFWISDFDEREMVGLFSVSSKNPMDQDQWIKVDWDSDDARGNAEGKSLRIDYDVDSNEPAKATFWLRLKEHDLTGFDTLHISLKGSDGARGNVTVQFVDANYRMSPYVIGHINSRWKEYQIPLKRFNRIQDWSSIREFDIVLDDMNAIPKEGSLWVDEIYVSKGERK